MYNQDIKARFIWDNEEYIRYGSAAYNAYRRLFILSSELEEELGKDLAAFNSDEIAKFEKLVDENLKMPPMRYRASMLRYLDWCHWHVDINASEGIDHILEGLNEYKNTVVSGPIHLQVSLDKIFDAENRHTIDVIYRCFLWMAFAGVRNKHFANSVTVNDVDLDKRIFFYNGDAYPIYPQALEAFDLSQKSTAFVYEHPNYTRSSDRINSDKLLRGIKADADSIWIAEEIKKKSKIACKKNPEVKRLSYRSVLHSGIFYRQYEAEAAGMDVDFSYLIKKTETLTGGRLTIRRAAINADLKDEYYIWKYLMYKDKV